VLRHFARRLIGLVPILIGVSLVVFIGIHMIPGDPAQVLLGDKATPEKLAEMRHNLGLDRPISVQYLQFVAGAVQGDFGKSYLTKTPVMQEISTAWAQTLELSVVGIGLAILIAIPVGVVSATRQYSWFDTGSMGFMLLGVSMPVFWTGLLLMLVFGVKLHWLPLSGTVSDRITLQSITHIASLDALLTGNWEAFGSVLQHLVLPGITLGLIPLAVIARQTRSAMLEVLNQDYIRTARAKGVATRKVNYKHALRNALIPVVTVVGLQMGSLLSGAVITETVFARPGMGRLAVTAIYSRDYPMVQGVVLIGALLIVLINLLVDLLYAYVDPRIHYS
jgi:peptide/nickel transport system permease protein